MMERLSIDGRIRLTKTNPLWDSIKHVYDDAVPMSPLPRGNSSQLLRSYSIQRYKTPANDLSPLLSSLPREFQTKKLGYAEADLLQFIINQEHDRVKMIIGARGCGKSSLIHYVENLLIHSSYKRKRVLLIIDGESLQTKVKLNRDLSVRDLNILMGAEFEHQLYKHHGLGYSDAFESGQEAFSHAETEDDAASALRMVLRKMGSHDTRHLTFIVDNLDPLPTRAIDLAFAYFRYLYKQANIGSVFCLRKGNLYSAIDRGTSMTVHRRVLTIHPPKVEDWLERFPERMEKMFRKIWRNTKPPTISGTTLNAEILREAMRRFVKEIAYRAGSSRLPDDDVIPYLRHMIGEDMRHYRELFRRILQHRSVPVKRLISMEKEYEASSRPDFHPITAMIEGDGTIYRDTWRIRNVYWFVSEQLPGQESYLILHRFLRLLYGCMEVPLDHLRTWMSLLGYEEIAVLEALNLLWDSHMVRWSCHDDRLKLDKSNLPRMIWLSEAGKFFVAEMISYADYLVQAVLDTPMNHTAYKKYKKINFLVRFNELFELMEIVLDEEEKEIQYLRKSPNHPAKKRIVDSLANGGWLSSSIISGIESGRWRSTFSEVPEVKQFFADPDTIKRIQSYTIRIDSLERKAGAILKGVSRLCTLSEPITYPSELGNIEIATEERGEAIGIRYKATGALSKNLAFLSISQVSENDRVAAAFACKPTKERREISNGTRTSFQSRYDCEFKPIKRIQGHLDLALQSVSLPESLYEAGLLSIIPQENSLAINFRTWFRKGTPLKFPGDLCTFPWDGEAVEKYIEENIPELPDYSAADQTVRIRSIGREIACRALSVDGMRRLRAYYPEVSIVLLYSPLHSIPWEWMLLSEKDEIPSLGENWQVIRWPWDVTAGLENLIMIESEKHPSPIHPWSTIGLHDGGNASLGQTVDEMKRAHYLHLIGHHKTDRIQLMNGNVTLREDDIKTNIPGNIQGVVLSICEGTRDSNLSRIAAAICEHWRCPCWVTLLPIPCKLADQLDLFFRKEALKKDPVPLSVTLKEARALMPLISGYVQFGLMRP